MKSFTTALFATRISRKSLCTCLAVLLLASGNSHADIVNIDLGRNATATTAAGYNNITDLTNADIINAGPNTNPMLMDLPGFDTIALVDSTNAATDFTAVLELDNIPNDVLGVAGAGGDFGGPYPLAGEASAMMDGLFLRDEDADGATEFVQVRLGGFSAADMVSFSIYGARRSNGLITDVSAIGSTTVFGSLDPNANTTDLITFNNLTADANGDIVVRINALGNAGSGTINFIRFEVSSIPEPSSAVFLALSSFALVCNRRRK